MVTATEIMCLLKNRQIKQDVKIRTNPIVMFCFPVMEVEIFLTPTAIVHVPVYGIMFYFSYTVSGNTLKLNFTKTDDYCGRSVDTPSSENVPYTLSGNILTM